MTINRLVVLSNPTPGLEDEYNDWYTNTHLAEVIEIPGFSAAQRFRLSPSQLEGFPPSQHRYLAIYEFDADPAESLKHLHTAVSDGSIPLPPSIDVDSIRVWTFESISERVSRS